MNAEKQQKEFIFEKLAAMGGGGGGGGARI